MTAIVLKSSKTILQLFVYTINSENPTDSPQRIVLIAAVLVILYELVPQLEAWPAYWMPFSPTTTLTITTERATGLEPATSSLGSWHSTN
jgi:hypothetical protein